QSGDVLRIRVRDRAGRVAFDPLHVRDGVFGEPDDEVVEAIDGERVALPCSTPCCSRSARIDRVITTPRTAIGTRVTTT
ncbi:MAG: hypothetical protein ABWY77_06410, partial [Acidimicrobiia bacterium]